MNIDSTGFALLANLRRRIETDADHLAADLGETPILLLVAKADDKSAEEGSPQGTSGRARTALAAGSELRASTARYSGRVAMVRKRPGNPFADMVTLGRSPTCDIVLDLPTVSKIHAFFLCEDGVWQLFDQHSMNKTRLKGKVITPGLAIPISSGDTVRFGQQAEFVFMLPDSFLESLREKAAWTGA